MMATPEVESDSLSCFVKSFNRFSVALIKEKLKKKKKVLLATDIMTLNTL